MRHNKKTYFKRSLVLVCKLFICKKTNRSGMGDGSHNSVQLSDLKYRERTFVRMSLQPPLQPHELAMNGFYYTSIADKIKCHGCDLVTMSSCFNSMNELNELHVARQPSCQYVTQVSQSSSSVKGSGVSECNFVHPPDAQLQQPQSGSSSNEMPLQMSPSNNQAPVVTQPGKLLHLPYLTLFHVLQDV